jgi:hypothetical protein
MIIWYILCWSGNPGDGHLLTRIYLIPGRPVDLDDHVGRVLAVQLFAQVFAGVALQVVAGIVAAERQPCTETPRVEDARRRGVLQSSL